MEACEQHLRLWIDLIGHIGSIERYRFRPEYWQTLSLNVFPQSKWCQKAYHNHMHVLTEPFWASEHTKREGEGEGKLCYQSWASKTIGDISWVICDPAFFILQRAAVYRGGFEDRGEMESDFSDKCWHRACLILESEKILIRCVFENSSDDLRSANWLAAAVFHPRRPDFGRRASHDRPLNCQIFYHVFICAVSLCVYVDEFVSPPPTEGIGWTAFLNDLFMLLYFIQWKHGVPEGCQILKA